MMIDKKARTIFREAFLKYIDYVDKTSPNFDNNMARKLSYNIGQLMGGLWHKLLCNA